MVGSDVFPIEMSSLFMGHSLVFGGVHNLYIFMKEIPVNLHDFHCEPSCLGMA